MLQFFPTPYPDELWYSVLCRYHIRSGNTSSAVTMHELFNREKQRGIGSPFPNNTMLEIVKQFPDNMFPLDKVILHNTLFNYFTRIFSYERKNKTLQVIKEGGSLSPQYVGTVCKTLVPGLRFCPICMENDKEVYGESYWHLEHQIPLMHICRKHKCRLLMYKCDARIELNLKFLLPENYNEKILVDYDINEIDLLLAEESYKYQYFPTELRPAPEYNNIYQGLLNRDFGMKPYNRIMNNNNLKRELTSFYGNDLVENVFGKKFNSAVMKSIRIWQYQSPERYILLAGLINQPFEVTFGPQISDGTVEKLLRIKERGDIYLKKDIMDELGVSATKLGILIEKYKIDPFWVKDKKRCSAAIYMSEPEYEKILNYMKKRNFTTISKFALHCMKEEINRQVFDEDEKLE